MVTTHPWKLAAPWYRWEHPGVPSSGRGSSPVFQKFASDDFVNEFLKNPQHSLKFDPEVDQVFKVNYQPVPTLVGPLFGKIASLYPNDAAGNKNPSITSLVPTDIRKIFLDTHSRHYLVVCELHCDTPGFPSPPHKEACQAGFVVRRHLMSYPKHAEKEAAQLLKEIVSIQAELAELDQTAPARPKEAKRRAERIQKMLAKGTFGPTRAALDAQLAETRAKLLRWKRVNGVHPVMQGWVPGAHERIGEWRIVEDTPRDNIVEAWYPMYPLIPDPAIEDHDAKGRTMFFGVLPTSSFDTDVNGRARYDDKSFYEVKCFVRRHDDHCPKRMKAPDCHGELVWSQPTERYQLASQFDLDGTSNRPVTIQMPNLAELAAQAAKRPFGKFSPVKVIQPQSLNPQTDGMSLSGGSMGGAQICFFSIPLITIVAMFVLNIFLPIVVFLFGLWFLLAFRFCIPPSLSIDASLQAELAAIPPSIDLDADFSVDVDIGGTLQTVTTMSLHGELEASLAANFATTTGLPQGDVASKLDVFSNKPLADLNSNQVELSKLPTDISGDAALDIDVTEDLEYEVKVQPEKVA